MLIISSFFLAALAIKGFVSLWLVCLRFASDRKTSCVVVAVVAAVVVVVVVVGGVVVVAVVAVVTSCAPCSGQSISLLLNWLLLALARDLL